MDRPDAGSARATPPQPRGAWWPLMEGQHGGWGQAPARQVEGSVGVTIRDFLVFS